MALPGRLGCSLPAALRAERRQLRARQRGAGVAGREVVGAPRAAPGLVLGVNPKKGGASPTSKMAFIQLA